MTRQMAWAALALWSCGPSMAVVEPTPELEAGGQSLAAESCKGGVSWSPSAGDAAAVAAAAAKHFPGATVSVNPARATVTTMFDVALPLGSCAPLGTAEPLVLGALEARPDVFRLRGKEWSWPGALRCDQIPEQGEWFRLVRSNAGGEPLDNQSIAVRLSARKGRVTLNAVFAHYLPADAALEARLAGCERQPDDTLIAAVWGATYPYRVFRYCVPQFDDVYKPAKGDTAALEKTALWHFSDRTGGVSLELLRGATLEVAQENVTPALLSSDAACPGQVGFRATADALSGAVVGTAAGIGCIVCLAP